MRIPIVRHRSCCTADVMLRRIPVCLTVAAATATLIVGCGSSSPTQPSTTPQPTAFAIVNGNTGFPEMILGPGDDLPIIGLTDTGPLRTGLPVDQMHLESSNPSVLRAVGSHVVGVAQREAEVRATYLTFSATAHAKVFPPSAVVRIQISGQTTCSQNERVDFLATAVLDDGTELHKPYAGWRSSASMA